MYKKTIVERPTKKVVQPGIHMQERKAFSEGIHPQVLKDPNFQVDRKNSLIHKSVSFYKRKLDLTKKKAKNSEKKVTLTKTTYQLKKERIRNMKTANAELLKSPYIDENDLKAQLISISASDTNNVFTDSDLFLQYMDRKKSKNIRQLEAYKAKLAKYYAGFGFKKNHDGIYPVEFDGQRTSFDLEVEYQQKYGKQTLTDLEYEIDKGIHTPSYTLIHTL